MMYGAEAARNGVSMIMNQGRFMAFKSSGAVQKYAATKGLAFSTQSTTFCFESSRMLSSLTWSLPSACPSLGRLEQKGEPVALLFVALQR
jgi:hypothetical protein